MKTHSSINQDDYLYYPDIQLCCATNDKNRYYKDAPKVIIEVLSQSTQRVDRAEKFANYQSYS